MVVTCFMYFVIAPTDLKIVPVEKVKRTKQRGKAAPILESDLHKDVV